MVSRITGGFTDRDTGLVRFGGRDFDATTGRWMTKDSIRMKGGLNLYAYAGNDPVNAADPTGEGPIGVTAAIACGMYEIYDIWSLSMELSELTQEVLVLEGMLHRTEEACFRNIERVDVLEIFDKRIAFLKSEIYRQNKKLARVRILGYATDAGLTLVCLGLARLPF